jgi:hypothetical protein
VSYNEYDQQGEYFVAAFEKFPTVNEINDIVKDARLAVHIHAGGGRRNVEYQWYELVEVETGDAYGGHVS